MTWLTVIHLRCLEHDTYGSWVCPRNNVVHHRVLLTLPICRVYTIFSDTYSYTVRKQSTNAEINPKCNNISQICGIDGEWWDTIGVLTWLHAKMMRWYSTHEGSWGLGDEVMLVFLESNRINMVPPNPRFAHAQTTHPNNMIYLSPEDERKHWLYALIFDFKFSGFRV